MAISPFSLFLLLFLLFFILSAVSVSVLIVPPFLLLSAS